MHLGLNEAIVFLACFIVCFLVVRNAKHLTPHRTILSLRETQAVHTNPVPRLGGVAIFAAVLITTLLVSPKLAAAYSLFVIALIPMVSVGVYEDMVGPVAARWRMSAIALSSVFAMVALKVWLPRTGIPALDPLMVGPIGAILTALIVTGVTNAFNLIDGLNGLCSGICLCAFAAINFLSESIGYETMGHLSMMYVAGIAAFLLFNFPFGRLFLGDSGAYLLGFILSWFSISVMLHSDHVSPWTFFLIFSYPIIDMLVSIIRRLAVRRSPFSADAGHFHHLVLNAVQSISFLRNHHRLHNPLATLAVLPIAIYPMIIGVSYYDEVKVLLLSSIGVVLIYCILYVLLRELRRRQATNVASIGMSRRSEFL